MRFLLKFLVSRSFLLLSPFFPISVCSMMSASNVPSYSQFSFFPRVLLLSWFVNDIISVVSLFPFCILILTHFQRQISSLYPGYICLWLVPRFPFYNWYSCWYHLYKSVNLLLSFCKLVTHCAFPKYMIEWYNFYEKKMQKQKWVFLEDYSLNFHHR